VDRRVIRHALDFDREAVGVDLGGVGGQRSLAGPDEVIEASVIVFA
jgi:hypothetical protein